MRHHREQLGFSPYWEAYFNAAAMEFGDSVGPERLIAARVIHIHRNSVIATDGVNTWVLPPAASLETSPDRIPLVGDWLAVRDTSTTQMLEDGGAGERIFDVEDEHSSRLGEELGGEELGVTRGKDEVGEGKPARRAEYLSDSHAGKGCPDSVLEAGEFSETGTSCSDNSFEHAPVRDFSAERDRPAQGRNEHVGASEYGILRRQTVLRRSAISSQWREQDMAANVDALVLIEPFSSRLPLARIDRFRVLAHTSGIPLWIFLSKIDLFPDADIGGVVASLEGYADEVRAYCAYDANLDHLRELLSSIGTVVLSGRSGAGKSSLINSLANLGVPTQPVREKDGKGRHTTTARSLVMVGDTCIIDTPGIRAVGIPSDTYAVGEAFADISELAENCRFSDCEHVSEPGCAVAWAVEQGDLEASRVSRYRKLLAEARYKESPATVREVRRAERKASKENKEGRRKMMRVKGKSPLM